MVRISNLEIIKLLEKNPRAPYSELSKSLGISDTAVRKRIRALEEKGVILRYSLDVDPRKLGYEIDALIGLDTTPESYIHVIDTIKEMSEVKSAYRSSGDHMIIVRSWFRDMDGLASFVKMLEALRGVTKVCPAIMLKQIK